MISLHLAVEIYAGLAVLSLVVGGLLLLRDVIKDNDGPRTLLGWVGGILAAALIAALWLPTLVVVGVLVLAIKGDDALADRRFRKQLLKDRRARGECLECGWDSTKFVKVAAAQYQRLVDAERKLSDLKYESDRLLQKAKDIQNGYHDKVPNPYNAPGYWVPAGPCNCDICRQKYGYRY